MKFILLIENESNEPVLINTERIISITSKGKGCIIMFTDEMEIEVKEDFKYFIDNFKF